LQITLSEASIEYPTDQIRNVSGEKTRLEAGEL